MSSLDNGLPRFDRLDLSPTKWEPDTAVARAPTPTKPVISKPSRKIPLRVPSKNVRDVDLDGIIAPHNVGEAPTPRVVIDEKNSSEVWSGFRVARRAKVSNVKIDSNDNIVVSASHNGYARLKGSPIHNIGASSRSPSPMATLPSNGTWSKMALMASTAAPSAALPSPFPRHAASAIAAASVAARK